MRLTIEIGDVEKCAYLVRRHPSWEITSRDRKRRTGNQREGATGRDVECSHRQSGRKKGAVHKKVAVVRAEYNYVGIAARPYERRARYRRQRTIHGNILDGYYLTYSHEGTR